MRSFSLYRIVLRKSGFGCFRSFRSPGLCSAERALVCAVRQFYTAINTIHEYFPRLGIIALHLYGNPQFHEAGEKPLLQVGFPDVADKIDAGSIFIACH